MADAGPWARPPRLPVAGWFGWFACGAAIGLGIVLAAYPAWVRGSAGEGGLLFPLVWLGECGVGFAFVAIGLAAVRSPWAAAERRVFRAALGGFGLSYMLLALAGFDWTGDWLRFAAFRAGLRTERVVVGAGPPEWRVYTWRSWGFAGLENDAYLVFDPSDRLAALPGSGILPGVACPIVEDRAMVLPWHLITTANCVLRRARGLGPLLDI